jgi:hypothetical protein
MGVYEDREKYREAVFGQPFSPEIRRIAREIDRLAGPNCDRGAMFEMQVAGVLYAAMSIGLIKTTSIPWLGC